MPRKSVRIKTLISIFLIILLFTGCSRLFGYSFEYEGKKPDKEELEGGKEPETLVLEQPIGGDRVGDEPDNKPNAVEEPPPSPQPLGTTSLKISAVGDIMVHAHQLKAAKQSDGSYDFTEVFKDIKPYLEEADIAIGNLETTISTDKIGYTAYPRFRSPESLISALKWAGFDVLTTANNHCLDGTEFGITNTLDKLDEYEIYHTGTARSQEERDKALILDVNDIKVAVLACTYGTNGMESAVNQDKLKYMVSYLKDIPKIGEDIQRAKGEGAEFIIVCAHWGEEYVRNPNEWQKDMADKLFDLGVDVIFGSHPHVIQPAEYKKISNPDQGEKDVFVIYSLGNIVSNQSRQYGKYMHYSDSGLIMNLEVIKDYDNDTLSIGDIDYIPTWVYKFTKDDKLHYRILPVRDFMDGKLDSAANERIKEVWKETTTHMDSDDLKARE